MQKKGMYQRIIQELILDLSEFEDEEHTRWNLATAGNLELGKLIEDIN